MAASRPIANYYSTKQATASKRVRSLQGVFQKLPEHSFEGFYLWNMVSLKSTFFKFSGGRKWLLKS